MGPRNKIYFLRYLWSQHALEETYTFVVTQNGRVENASDDLGHRSVDGDAELSGEGVVLEAVLHVDQVFQDSGPTNIRLHGREPGIVLTLQLGYIGCLFLPQGGKLQCL